MQDIDYDKAEYVTNRELPNDDGEKTGRVKMFSYDNETYHYQIKCPYCGHQFENSEKLGSRPWWIECPECGRSSNVKRIKDAAKKDIKNRAPEPDDL